MEAPGQTCLRLLTALEALAAEEQRLVRGGQIRPTLVAQQRAQSIIGRLAELLDRPEVAARAAQTLLPRVDALRANHAVTLDLLDSRLAENQTRQSQVAAARGRLTGMKAAYGAEPEPHRSPVERFRHSA